MSSYTNRNPIRRQTQANNYCECSFGCGASIHFIRSVKFDAGSGRWIAGSYIPVENELFWGDGIKTLVAIYPPEMRGRVLVKADPEIQGYEPHFGYCEAYQRQEKTKAIRRQRAAKQIELF